MFQKPSTAHKRGDLVESLSDISGLLLVTEETRLMEEKIKTAYLTIGNSSGTAVYTYGSLARTEFIGEGSDIDVFFIENESDRKKTNFAQAMGANLDLDLPDWNSPEELEKYAKIGLIERNQILDLKFISGDNLISSRIESLQASLDTLEHALINLVFHRFYFDSYLQTRTETPKDKLKYGRGGSRELAFINWFDRLIVKDEVSANKSFKYPHTIQALGNFVLFDDWQYDEMRQVAIAVCKLFEARHKLLNKGGSINLEQNSFDLLAATHEKIWSKVVAIISGNKSKEISNAIAMVRTQTSNSQNVLKDNLKDPLARIAFIWDFHLKDFPILSYNEAFEACFEYQDWPTLASLAFNRLTNTEQLDRLTSAVIQKTGLGFIARIIAKHPETSKATLENIANCYDLVDGHRIIAIERLER